jgi:hypothetical protein
LLAIVKLAQTPIADALAVALDVLSAALGFGQSRGPVRQVQEAPDGQVHLGRLAAGQLQLVFQDRGAQRLALGHRHAGAHLRAHSLIGHVKEP